jgi:hypothetical protein
MEPLVKEPVDHILRPQLPWRTDPGMTECGYDATKVPTLTREQYAARLKDMGQQRCAMVTCMTCTSTYQRWARWEDDPRRALGREIEWEVGAYYSRDSRRGFRLRDELQAIAAGGNADALRIHLHRLRRSRLLREREQAALWRALRHVSGSARLVSRFQACRHLRPQPRHPTFRPRRIVHAHSRDRY